MNEKPSVAILVLGMHRSGTSAATRVLNLLGVDLGKDLLRPAEDNSKGFWEHRQVLAIHERLLSELGRSWHDIRSLPKGWLESAAARNARDALLVTLASDFSTSPVWAVKDPRLCRLLPLWTPLAGELGVCFHALHVARHPDEVAASLRARNDLSLEHVRMLWLQHVVEAQVGAAGLPRALLHFDQLLRDWRAQMVAVADELGLEWPASIDDLEPVIESFLNPLDRHHEASPLELDTLPKLIRRVHDACHVPVREVSWGALGKLVGECQDALGSLLPVLNPFQEQLGRATEKLYSADRAAKDLKEENERLTTTLAGLAARLPQRPAENEHSTDEAKIYYRGEGETYLEERTASCLWPLSDVHARLVFEFDSEVRMDFVRFDPAEAAGEFEVSGIWLDGLPLPVGEQLRCVHQYRLPSGAGLLRFGGWGRDPWIELEMPASARQAVVRRIEVECKRVDVVQKELLDLVEKRILVNLRPLSAGLDEVREGSSASAASLRALEETSRSQLQKIDLLERRAAEEKEKMKQQMDGAFRQVESNQAMLQERLDDMGRCYEDIRERLNRRWFDFLRGKR